MFARVRSKLGEPFGKHKPAEPAAAGEEKAEEAGAADTLVTQISNLEELVNRRTQELEKAKAQLSQLSSDNQVMEEDGAKAAQTDGFFTKPNQGSQAPPEKAVEAQDQSPSGVKEKATEPAQAKKEETPPQATAKAPAEAAAKPAGAEDDSFSNLFSQDEKEENPLAGLINSLPDATAAELLGEARQVQTMLQEWK